MTTFGTLRNQVLKVGVSSASGQVLTFLSLPILSRLYAPESFGGWALFVSVGLLIGTVATLRYELAVVLPEKNHQGAELLIAGLITTLVIGVAAIVFAPPLTRVLVAPDELKDIENLTWALPILVIVSAGYQLGLSWATRRAAFSQYSIAQFLLPAGTATTQVCVALLGFTGAGGLIAGTILGYTLAALVMWTSILVKFKKELVSAIVPGQILASARQYWQYPAFMTPYTLLSVIRDRAIYFLLSQFAAGGVVGYYSMAQRITNIPNSLVSGAIRPVFFQFAARRDMKDLVGAVVGIMAALLIVSVPNLAVFVLYAEPLVTLVFGEKWAASAPIVVMLAFPAIPLLLGNWLDRLLDINGRQKLAFGLEATFSIVTLLVLFVGFLVVKNVQIAIALQASVMTVYFWLWIFVVFRVAGFALIHAVRLLLFSVVLFGASLTLLLITRSVAGEIAALACLYLTLGIGLSLFARKYWRFFGEKL